MTDNPRFAGRSRVFTVHSKGGGGSSLPAGPPSDTARFAGRANVFTVPKKGGKVTGGGLFGHGVIVQNAEATWRGARPGVSAGFWRTPLWDSDSYFTDATHPPQVPTGLGGIYLLLVTIPYEVDISGGWWLAKIETGPSYSSPSGNVGQWQQGYRAATALAGAPTYINLHWIGRLEEGDYFSWATDYNPSIRSGADVTLSAFRLGDVDDADPEPAFHGALISYDGGGPHGYTDMITGTPVFDTDNFYDDWDGIYVRAGLDGFYVAVQSWTFTVDALHGADSGMWLIPWLGQNNSGTAGVPENAMNGWFEQIGIGDKDMIDCNAASNEVSLSFVWFGNLREDDVMQSIIIHDRAIEVINGDPTKTYLAVVRLADSVVAP